MSYGRAGSASTGSERSRRLISEAVTVRAPFPSERASGARRELWVSTAVRAAEVGEHGPRGGGQGAKHAHRRRFL